MNLNKERTDNAVTSSVASAANGTDAQTVLLQQAAEEKKIICEVCGHANPENTAICCMCSNYLLI